MKNIQMNIKINEDLFNDLKKHYSKLISETKTYFSFNSFIINLLISDLYDLDSEDKEFKLEIAKAKKQFNKLKVSNEK